MTNMPITFVTPWYDNFAGGAEVAVRTLAENLSRRGFDVQVLTTCCCSPFDNWWQNKLPSGVEKINGVTVRRFPVKRHGEETYHEINQRIIQRQEIEEKYQRQFVENTINSEELIHYAKNNTQGHLVIGIPYTQGLIYSLIQSLEGRASIMPCFHDEPQFRWITTVEMLELSRHIFFLTEEEKSLAIKYYGNSFGRKIIEATVIGVGVELPIDIDSLILNSSLVTRITSHYNLPRKFFIYVGRKDIGKNILTLIQFFKNYRANGGEANLVFLGGGDTNLVPLEEGFLDLGFVPETDKYIIISQALGLINLSQNESFSLVIMEAWLCEIPVIVHEECKVTTAHCRNTGGGISILSSEEFEAALKILSIQDKGKIIGRYGKRYVKRNYSWDCVIESFLRGAYQR
ncbi:glycosyltransferase family 4 protein [Nostoc sp.]|uniref:glycosyltransferase family 4 protein n=1 Tax=Nostoc sp. TaxID=1180 RepID=UPI002FF4ED00